MVGRAKCPHPKRPTAGYRRGSLRRPLSLLGRLDLDDLVLLDTLGVLGDLQDHDALATDNVLGFPAHLRVYIAHDGLGPSLGVGLGARGHAGEADDLSILLGEAKGPHQALAEFGVLRLDVSRVAR